MGFLIEMLLLTRRESAWEWWYSALPRRSIIRWAKSSFSEETMCGVWARKANSYVSSHCALNRFLPCKETTQRAPTTGIDRSANLHGVDSLQQRNKDDILRPRHCGMKIQDANHTVLENIWQASSYTLLAQLLQTLVRLWPRKHIVPELVQKPHCQPLNR